MITLLLGSLRNKLNHWITKLQQHWDNMNTDTHKYNIRVVHKYNITKRIHFGVIRV